MKICNYMVTIRDENGVKKTIDEGKTTKVKIKEKYSDCDILGIYKYVEA